MTNGKCRYIVTGGWWGTGGAASPVPVTGPEEPDMALARGAALASANAPLFASSTAALAYAL
ncbi:hypothetical protein, partial [Mycobacterium avium]|uniref:hypothetical protein n=1 Tax=Mycobacterium avium TaxID=1764 RepID=UPI00293A0F51